MSGTCSLNLLKCDVKERNVLQYSLDEFPVGMM
jgi:hypothetical protein